MFFNSNTSFSIEFFQSKKWTCVLKNSLVPIVKYSCDANLRHLTDVSTWKVSFQCLIFWSWPKNWVLYLLSTRYICILDWGPWPVYRTSPVIRSLLYSLTFVFKTREIFAYRKFLIQTDSWWSNLLLSILLHCTYYFYGQCGLAFRGTIRK